MGFLNSFNKKRFLANADNFESLSVELFRHQAKHNKIYSNYLNALKVNPQEINSVTEIPFLPISFFKSHEVITGSWIPEQIFESSGTTGENVSRHLVPDTNAYTENCLSIFKLLYGEPNQYHIMGLLPSYLDRNNSSLVLMVDMLIKKSRSEYSGFYLNEWDKLARQLREAYTTDRKVLLIGVSFGLLDFIEHCQFDMPKLIVMETGGMKGRRKELIREELHNLMKKGFAVNNILSEYGMTELMSQAYAQLNGAFQTPPWMRVMIRDINDPLSYVQHGRSGGINIIDLANVHSCAFIETQDVGRILDDGTFEVLGRFDNSDIRGCNLMVV